MYTDEMYIYMPFFRLKRIFLWRQVDDNQFLLTQNSSMKKNSVKNTLSSNQNWKRIQRKTKGALMKKH